ncbi:MAG: TIM barrel protein [Clostridiales bacterium]|jgi:hydroxypyruvate isomerase|nr:TIM barrel protein [Clostridiales bacterium]
MKLSVCVEALFNGWDITEGMKAIKEAGVDAFEFWGWWGKDLDEIKRAKEELGLNIAAFCTRMISLVDSTLREDYIKGLKETIEVARYLGCNKLITQVGNELGDVDRGQQRRNLVDGLKTCSPILEDAGITLLVEPLNTLVDHKGYYLYSSAEAFEIIDEVNSPNIKILYDIYHQQIMEGNLIANITQNINKIGHFHAAGNPGRHELTIGEINYGNVFKAIKESGYEGYVGLEYFPVEDPVKGLLHIKSFFE